MKNQTSAIDLSEYNKELKTKPEKNKSMETENRNGVYVAVIVVSFALTVMLYAVAFKNQNPGKPNIKPLPAVDNWQEQQSAP
jgi:hypothetical protein